MKNFEERLNDILKSILNEDNDVTEMSSNQYAHGADADSQKPSGGTVRNANKKWFGSRKHGQKMPEYKNVNSKNTSGNGPKI